MPAPLVIDGALASVSTMPAIPPMRFDADFADSKRRPWSIVPELTGTAMAVPIGTAVAVEFNLRRGRGVRFFKGTVMRLFAASARVRFREFDDTYLDYDIAHARLFIPSPTAD